MSPFDDFIFAVEPLIRRTHSPVDAVAAVQPYLEQLVRQPGWLAQKYRLPIPEKPYAQYLLYRPEDRIFSVVSFVWNPGQGSPIHDHCTWGVVGQYEGEEEEMRFRRTAGHIEQIGIHVARPGDVAHVYPPERDIHQIVNRSAAPTISIHVYGGDIGSQQRHVFDPVSGEMRGFVSGYDPAGC